MQEFMPEKIIFLGTGGDTEVVGKQLLASGGIVIQAGNNQFLVDPGPGCTVRAKQFGVNLRENTAILVTSNNLVNANDINAAIDATTIGGLDKKAVVICNDTLMNGAGDIKPYLNPEQKKNVERILVLSPGQKIGVNDSEIHVLKAKQKDPNAIGLKFVTPQATITYTGDTEFFKEMTEGYRDTDVLIVNVQESEESEKGKLNTVDAIEIIEKAKPKLAVLTHFGTRLLREDRMDIGREMQRQAGCQVMIAKDGMGIDLTGIGSKKQETLESYQRNNQETKETSDS
jgi:ribonuclease BN (tRNA processing enzyme)